MLDFTRLDDIRQQRPLVHCVSNIVSANDCANLALAVGASPIMAQASQEMADITAASRATVLNTGTPEGEKFTACLLCGKEAKRLGQPIILDPVGVGASPWRLEQIRELLHLFTPTILRVNLGEAQALSRRNSQEQGVDSLAAASLWERIETAAHLAKDRRATVLLSGPEDIVTDGVRTWRVTGGSDWMSRVTGTGCMLSVLCGAFAAVEPEPGKAAVLAAAFWKVCSRRAEQAAGDRGPGSFRTALLDAAGTLTAAEFAAEASVMEV
jgi:hydroxyethylthiazole kinase